MCSARAARLALLLLAAPVAVRAQGGDGHATPARAPAIDTIVVERRDIFGPGSGAPPLVAKLGDALHVRTTERTIRRALYLDPGMPYDSARIAEAERGLRALAVFRDVRIDTARIATGDGERFGVVVRTADGWTTKPQLEYRSTAGDVTWQVGLVEENLLGTATLFSALYGRTPDRDYLSLAYGNQAFLTRRSRLDLRYDRLTDGTIGAWRLGVPFYETTTPAALLTFGHGADRRVLVYRAGVLAESWRQVRLVAGVTGGFAVAATPTSYARVTARASVRREDYAPDSLGVTARSVFGEVGVGYEVAQERWAVREYLDSYGRREDVDLSRRVAVGVSALPKAFGYADAHAGVGLEAGLQGGWEWSRFLASASARAHGVLNGAGIDTGRVAARLSLAAFPARQSVLLRIEGALARDPAPGGEYDLWAQRTGPRLFGAHAFTGTRAYSVSLEDRIAVTGDLLGLFALGIAPFVDQGGAWFADDGRRTGGNAGLAIRIGPTRAASGEVFELAGGWRWSNDPAIGGWALSFGTAYRFFRPS